MRRRAKTVGLWVVLVALSAGAGALGSRLLRLGDPSGPLARGAAEAARLDVALDGLQDRLLVAQARVRFWQELQSRHESVSAVACANLAEHARAMTASAERLDGRAREQRRARLATVTASAGGVGGPE